jgi:hypothetical protein
MKAIFSAVLTAALLLLAASCGEDRAGEQPFAPTVRLISATASGDSVVMEGEITASPNSSVKACGFYFGNDTLQLNIAAKADSNWTGNRFNATVRALQSGTYYAAAYATNGMGTTASDTTEVTVR